jgi:hypothetical protein
VTPEQVYSSVNITHYDYRRTSTNGVGLLTVDVWGTQVRVTGDAAFSQTQAPSGADPVNGGVVSPGAASSAQQVDASTAD